MKINKIETKLKEIILRTHNVKSFRVDTKDKSDFLPGQFLFVKVGAGEGMEKPLSISSSPTEGYIEFTKKLTGSAFSNALDALRAGDRVELRYPYGNFTFTGETRKIAFMSGGIGITPIRSICKYLTDKKTGTDVVLFYGNRTVCDIAFKEDFEDMKNNGLVLKTVHLLQDAGPDWTGGRGHINADTVKGETPDYLERKFYLCGSPAMVANMKDILSAGLEVSTANIVTENFVGY